MQKYCPSCAKSGVKSKIRAFQLNFEEAVFMCSAEKCIWPAGCQSLTFINRPVGKDWSKDWDEAEAKYFQSESDPLLELSAYTPPQTPGTELGGKDVSVTSSAIKVETTTVPDKIFYAKTVENIESVESFEQNGFENLDVISNSNFDNDISSFDNDIKSFDKDISNFDNGISSLKKEVKNYKILKPKLVITNPINYKVEKGVTNDPVFIKQCDRTTVLDKNSDRQINCTNETITNKTTSLVYKCEVNNQKPSILKVSPRKEISRLSIRSRLRRKKSNVKIFEKFDFNDLMQQKAKKIKDDPYKKESIKTENSQNIIKLLKIENNSAFSFDLDKMLIETSTNLNRINNLELSNYNEKIIRCKDKDQINFDSILGLTSSSKDSGVDQDMVDNIDMDLEELLAGFSDDLTSSMNYNAHYHNSHKTSIEETDENKWINSLFE